MPDPGMMDREITLLEMLETTSESGATTREESEIDTVWAQVSPLGGREMVKAGTTLSEQLTIFTIYWRDDISFGNFIKYEDETYDIVNVKELGRREFLQLTGRLTK